MRIIDENSITTKDVSGRVGADPSQIVTKLAG